MSHYFLTEGVKKVRIHDVNKEKSEQLCEIIRNKNPKFNFKIWNYNKNNFDYSNTFNPNKVMTSREKYVVVNKLEIFESIYIKKD